MVFKALMILFALFNFVSCGEEELSKQSSGAVVKIKNEKGELIEFKSGGVLDFGKQDVGMRHLKEVTFIATGQKEYYVSKYEWVSNSQKVFSTIEKKEELPRVSKASPGVLKMYFQPLKKDEAYSGEIKVFFENLDSGPNPFIIKLKGVGRAPVVNVDPNPVDFGDIVINRDHALPVAITNKGDSKLTLKGFAIEKDKVTFSLDNLPSGDLVLEPGKDYEITVKFAPTKRLKYSDTLVLKTDHPSRPTTKILLEGRGIGGKVKVEPPKLDFGLLKKGEKKGPLSIKVTNEGNSDLKVNDFEYKVRLGNNFVVANELKKGMILKIGESHQMSFTYQPQDHGVHDTTLSLKTNDPDSPVFLLKILAGTKGPKIEVDHVTQSLRGNLDLTQEIQIGVWNLGTDTLQISNAYLKASGSDPDCSRLSLVNKVVSPISLDVPTKSAGKTVFKKHYFKIKYTDKEPKAGNFSCSLFVKSNAINLNKSNNGEIEATIKLSRVQ